MDKYPLISEGDKMSDDKTPEFYKNFYDENRFRLLQYDSLRGYFNKMVDDVLGDDYYNMGMDVYEGDRLCCEDITFKSKSLLSRVFK